MATTAASSHDSQNTCTHSVCAQARAMGLHGVAVFPLSRPHAAGESPWALTTLIVHETRGRNSNTFSIIAGELDTIDNKCFLNAALREILEESGVDICLTQTTWHFLGGVPDGDAALLAMWPDPAAFDLLSHKHIQQAAAMVQSRSCTEKRTPWSEVDALAQFFLFTLRRREFLAGAKLQCATQPNSSFLLKCTEMLLNLVNENPLLFLNPTNADSTLIFNSDQWLIESDRSDECARAQGDIWMKHAEDFWKTATETWSGDQRAAFMQRQSLFLIHCIRFINTNHTTASKVQFLARQAQVAELTKFHDQCSNGQKASMSFEDMRRVYTR
jgi:hypothetical protein